MSKILGFTMISPFLIGYLFAMYEFPILIAITLVGILFTAGIVLLVE